MLQEIIARTLGRDVGAYRHFAGSLHLYKNRWEDAQNFVNEGYQQKLAMPEMPLGDPWPAIAIVLEAEKRARSGETFEASSLGLQDYWSDLVRIIQIFFAQADQARITCLAEQITFKRYRPYIISRL